MPRQPTGAHGIQRVLQHGLAAQKRLQFVLRAARRLEAATQTRREDNDNWLKWQRQLHGNFTQNGYTQQHQGSTNVALAPMAAIVQ